MRRMALDWTLSRRQRVDFGAPPQTWEQYSKEQGPNKSYWEWTRKVTGKDAALVWMAQDREEW